MNVALWILQVLLAVLFLLHGYLYVVWPPAMVEQMRQRSPNPQQDVLGISPGFRRFIGVAEWLAAVGLIAPGVIPTAILFLLVTVVAYMRWQVVPL